MKTKQAFGKDEESDDDGLLRPIKASRVRVMPGLSVVL